MALFCFYCGKVSRDERKCTDKKRDAIRGSLIEGQYVEWIKAKGNTRGVKQDDRIEQGNLEADESCHRISVGRRVEEDSQEGMHNFEQQNEGRRTYHLQII